MNLLVRKRPNLDLFNSIGLIVEYVSYITMHIVLTKYFFKILNSLK